MKFLTSAFVLFVLIVTSSTASLAQKTRVETVSPRVESKTEMKQESPLPTKVETKTEVKKESKKARPAVEFADANAYSDGNGVYIKWKMVTETDNLGFQVFRIRKGDTAVIVQDKFTPSSSLRSREDAITDEEYSIFDPDGSAKDRYYVESYERNGNRTTTRSFAASKVDDISPVAGDSSSSFVQRLSEATGRESDAAPVFDGELQTLVNQNLLAADPTNQKWVAAQPGVKFGVRQSGMYRVTRAQLQTAGFDVNSDPNNWQLYTDGVEQAIIVGPSGDYVDFYGRPIDTVESETKMYYLLVGPQPGKRMATTVLRPSIGTLKATSYTQTVQYKERFFYLVDVINGDGENYFGRFIGSSVTTPVVNLGPVDTSGTARLKLKIMGYTKTAHAINVTVNGHLIGQATGPTGTGSNVTLDVTFPGSFLTSGNNNVGLASVVSGESSVFDSVEITYKRGYTASQNALSFTVPNFQKTTVQGFTSPNVRVFETTYDGNPTLLLGPSVTPDGNAYDLNLPAYRNRSIFAVEDSALLSPATISINNPSTLSSGTHNAQLVIISYKDFMDQANTWAAYRRNQGFSVEVVDVDDIFDEFNFGVLSANSMRDFLNFTRSNWQTPPQYVLLIGDGTYDPRNYEGWGYFDLVPVKLVDTGLTVKPLETASDDAIVDFNNDGLAEMAIGRIPARTAAMATNAYNKTVAFEALSATQNLSRGVIFHYDNAGLGWDFLGMSNLMASQLPVGTNNVLVPRADTSPNQTLVNEINNGRYFFNFNGHGTATSFASTPNFIADNVPLLTNSNGLTVFTMLTCLNGYFQNVGSTGVPSLAEALLNSPTGGAAAGWASSGETTPDVQQLMGTHFYQKLGEGQITRLGDLIVDAKTVISAGRDVRLSWVLIGDPMLKVR